MVSATATFACRTHIMESAANRAIERRITSPALRAAVNLQLPETQKFPAVGLEEIHSIGGAAAWHQPEPFCGGFAMRQQAYIWVCRHGERSGLSLTPDITAPFPTSYHRKLLVRAIARWRAPPAPMDDPRALPR